MNAIDVAIIGGGPAGCRAAWRLARAGTRVALFDGSHPREKPCGGGVTGRALDLVRDAINIASLRAVAIDDVMFEQGSRRARVQLGGRTGPTPQLSVASRTAFDGTLLAAAVEAGAAFHNTRVTSVVAERDGWSISTADTVMRAKWLLGADGPNSLVRRQVGQPFARADLSIATGFFVHGIQSRSVAIAFEDEPPGYLWSFPRPDHLAVGVCAQADASHAATLRAAAADWITRNVEGSFRLKRYSWPIPSLRESTLEHERPWGERWMLLGDAGGMVDPITREGIFFALLSGEAAADSLLEGGTPGVRYGDRIRALVYDELLRAARLKARFFNPRFTTLLVRALQQSAAIRAIMADLVSGRQTYRGLRRRLLGTMQVRLFIEMLKK
jgi:geranylgeranyl reductase family protein